MTGLTQALHRMAQMQGQAPAVIGARRTRTWRQWCDDVARLAAGLRRHGVAEGDRVAVMALNSDRYLDALYAVPWAGGVVVPINARLSVPEVAYILGHANVRCVFVDLDNAAPAAAAARDAGVSPLFVGLEPGDADLDIAWMVHAHAPCIDRGRRGHDLSGIFYTGGTTGRSKGVMLRHEHHHVHSLAMWSGRAVDPAQLRYLHAAPMFHIADAEFIYGITAIGGSHHVIPRFEAGAFLEAVERWRITDAVLVPTMIQMLLDHPALITHDTTSLTRLWYGGSPMPEQTIVRLLQALPHVAPIQLFGQTEAGPIITMLEPQDHDPPPTHRARRRSAGRAVAGCHVRVVDEGGQDRPIGEVGEIVARSGSVMAGYWCDPEQTERALRDGWLYTGDAGYLDEDGYLYVTDRFKDMIITGGENVFSTEVEQVIYTCPGVAQCAVIGLPDARWGERVHAVLVPQSGQHIDESDLMRRLREALAGYKVPRSLEVRHAPLPVSGAGKILKRELRRQAQAALGEPEQAAPPD